MLEPRWADGRHKRLLELVAELVRLRVDVLRQRRRLAARQALTTVVAAGISYKYTGDFTGLTTWGTRDHAQR